MTDPIEAAARACMEEYRARVKTYSTWDDLTESGKAPWRNRAQAAITAYKAAELERGWKMVPLAVTKEMSLAGEEAADQALDYDRDTNGCYVTCDSNKAAFLAWQAMWSAAPFSLHHENAETDAKRCDAAPQDKG